VSAASNAIRVPVLAPLIFTPVLLPKVWGGRRLARWNKPLPHGEKIGESWELADLDSTSASGAGGQAVHSIVARGPLTGKTLGDVGGFPLLIKLLDASQNLSVQVHPSPRYAHAHPSAHLKTESWYILDTEAAAGGEPASLYIGLREGVTHAEFAAAARAQAPSVVGLLNRVPAVVGECYTLPSGTVHALGAGVVVAEVQTPSDTTFRLYDWGRSGRELHVEQGLMCMGDGAGAAADATCASLASGALCGRLSTTPFYTIDEARPLPGDDLTIGYACRNAPDKPFALMVLAGTGELWHSEDGFPRTPISIGQTMLIPASIARQTRLRASEGLQVLRVGVCAGLSAV